MKHARPKAMSLSAPIAAYAGFELIQRIILPAFLTGPVGLSLAVAAPLLLGLRLMDVACDVVLGALSDAFGARKAMMVLGAAIALPATLAVGVFGPQTPVAFLVFCILCSVLGWSALNAAQAALSLEAGRDIKGRGEVFAWRTVASIAGLSLLATTTAAAGSDIALQMRWGALALLVITPLLLGLMLWRVEAAQPALMRFRLQGIVDAVALAWADRKRARLAVLFALAGAHASIWATGFAFVIQQGLALPGLLGAALLIQAAAAIAGAFLWLRALKQIGARNVLATIFAAEAGFAATALLIPSGNATLALIWVGARGLAAGAEVMVLRALTGDFLDADTRVPGRLSAGALTAAFQLPFAVSAALAAAGLLWTLEWAGFDPKSGGRAALIVTATMGALISGAAFIIASGMRVDAMSSQSLLAGRVAPDG